MTREEAITTLEKIQKLLAIYPKRKKQKESVNEIDTAIGMAIDALEREEKWLNDFENNVPSEPRGTYQCFHCGSCSVVWGNDFSFEDYGIEGEGIVHSCHCGNCGADIEYYVPIGGEDD